MERLNKSMIVRDPYCSLMKMRMILYLLCTFLSIQFIDNSQCQSRSDLVGYCGCCPIIGGNCIYYDTIDGMDVSWHLCVPDQLKMNFSLEQCQPNVTMDRNSTRLCRTKNGTFRLFPQCATKEHCRLPISRRNFTPQCNTTMVVQGPCAKSFKRFSYDVKRRECVPFRYSGCGGSTNRFIRQDRCEKLCKKTT